MRRSCNNQKPWWKLKSFFLTGRDWGLVVVVYSPMSPPRKTPPEPPTPLAPWTRGKPKRQARSLRNDGTEKTKDLSIWNLDDLTYLNTQAISKHKSHK